VQYKNISAMIFNEIKFYVNTSLGLVGWMHPLHPPPVPRLLWDGAVSGVQKIVHDKTTYDFTFNVVLIAW